MESALPTPPVAPARRMYRFNDVQLDIAGREILRNGHPVPLSPAGFDCIAYLVEHRDRAVGRDELIAAVWGRTEIAENLLAKTLVRARRALGDSGREQQVIRTVPRFGYHWVAPVREVVPETEPEPEPETGSAAGVAAAAPHRFAPRRAALVLASLVATAALAALALFLLPARDIADGAVPGAGHAAAAAAPGIAVLPVRVSASRDDAWLRLGLMDLIANRLRDAGLSVLPSESIVRMFGDTAARPGELAGLDAGRTLHAHVQKQGEQWLMHMELVEANGRVREFQARSDSPIAVARQAVDQALAGLGQGPGKTLLAIDDYSLLELSQRAEAAILANDDEGARRLIAAAPAALRASPELQFRLAFIDYRAGRAEPARARLQQLLDDSLPSLTPVLQARALTILGALALRESRPAAARAPLQQAIALLDRHPDVLAAGHAHMGMGIAGAMQGDYEQAADQFAQARVAFGLAGDVHALARVDINEGAMDNLRDRPAEAMAILERAAGRFERLQAPSELGTVLINQIKASLALLDTPRALLLGERLMPLAEQLHNPEERFLLQLIRAHAFLNAGRLSESAAILASLEQATVTAGHPVLAAQAAVAGARLALAEGEMDRAADLGRRSTPSLQGVERARDRALAWRIAIRALLAEGRVEEAAGEVAALAAWAGASQLPAARLAADLTHAQLSWARGDEGAADALHQAALQRAELSGVPADLLAVATSYGQTLLARERLPEAARVIGHVARWADRDFDSAMLQVELYQALGETHAWHRALEQARALAGERPVLAAGRGPSAAGPSPVDRQRVAAGDVGLPGVCRLNTIEFNNLLFAGMDRVWNGSASGRTSASAPG